VLSDEVPLELPVHPREVHRALPLDVPHHMLHGVLWPYTQLHVRVVPQQEGHLTSPAFSEPTSGNGSPRHFRGATHNVPLRHFGTNTTRYRHGHGE
jgi:hypothetical protein